MSINKVVKVLLTLGGGAFGLLGITHMPAQPLTWVFAMGFGCYLLGFASGDDL